MTTRKLNVLFVCSGNSKYKIVPFIKRQGDSLQKQGVNINYFLITDKGLFGYLKNIIRLRIFLKKNRFDIIHSHYGMSGLVSGLASIFLNSKISRVISIMGDDAYGSYNSKGNRIFLSYFEMFLTQISLLFCNAIIVKSKNILKYIPYKNISYVIPNGVDFKLFKPDGQKISKKKNVLFLANPNDPRKNYILAKKAIEKLKNYNVKLYNPFPIKPDDFPIFLNDSSLFLLTSFNEGSPNVIKEAMACNIPIVSTNVGDVKEVIGKTEGCFIAKFDPLDVSKKILEALNFNKRTTGRSDIQHLRSDIIAKRIINIYNKII